MEGRTEENIYRGRFAPRNISACVSIEFCDSRWYLSNGWAPANGLPPVPDGGCPPLPAVGGWSDPPLPPVGGWGGWGRPRPDKSFCSLWIHTVDKDYRQYKETWNSRRCRKFSSNKLPRYIFGKSKLSKRVYVAIASLQVTGESTCTVHPQ